MKLTWASSDPQSGPGKDPWNAEDFLKSTLITLWRITQILGLRLPPADSPLSRPTFLFSIYKYEREIWEIWNEEKTIGIRTVHSRRCQESRPSLSICEAEPKLWKFIFICIVCSLRDLFNYLIILLNQNGLYVAVSVIDSETESIKFSILIQFEIGFVHSHQHFQQKLEQIFRATNQSYWSHRSLPFCGTYMYVLSNSVNEVALRSFWMASNCWFNGRNLMILPYQPVISSLSNQKMMTISERTTIKSTYGSTSSPSNSINFISMVIRIKTSGWKWSRLSESLYLI